MLNIIKIVEDLIKQAEKLIKDKCWTLDDDADVIDILRRIELIEALYKLEKIRLGKYYD